MKKLLICIVAIAQISIYMFYAAQTENEKWQHLEERPGVETVGNLQSFHDNFAAPLDFSDSKVKTSEMWEIDIQKSNFRTLYNNGINIKDQWIKVEDIGYEVNDEIEEVDLLVTINNATTIEGYAGPTYIKVADDLSSIYTSGYLQIDFTVNFFESGTSDPQLINPILGVGDLDKNEVVGTNSFLKNIVVTDKSNLKYGRRNNIHLVTNDEDASPNDQNNWVSFDLGNTSSIEFTFGMNKLDPTESHNVEGEYTTFDLRIKPDGGKIAIDNSSENGIPVADSYFDIYKGTDQITTVKTNLYGYAETQSLEPGVYTIKQKSTSEQYIIDTTPYQIDVKGDSDSDSIGVQTLITNKMISGNAEVTVIDEAGNAVGNVSLDIYNKKTGEKVTTISTNDSGMVMTPQLYYGEYYIRIDSLPSQYMNNDQQYEFKISSNGQLLKLDTITVNTINSTLDEESTTGYVRIKTSSAEGTEFYVYDDVGNLVDTIIIDDEGVGTSKQLSYGSYCIEGDNQQLCFELTSELSMQEFVTDDSLSNKKNQETSSDKSNNNQNGENSEVGSNSEEELNFKEELVNKKVEAIQSEVSEPESEVILTENFSPVEKYIPVLLIVVITFLIGVVVAIKKGGKNG